MIAVDEREASARDRGLNAPEDVRRGDEYFIRTNAAADQVPFRNGAVFDLLPLVWSHLGSSYAPERR
jgi:hypothetical protein